MLCFVLSSLIYAFASKLILLYLGGMFLGLGVAWTTTTMTGFVINKWFAEKKGTILGIILASNGIGAAVAIHFLTPVIYRNAFGYRRAYVLTAFVLLVIIALILLFAVRPVFAAKNDRPFYILMGIMICMAIGLCAYVHLWDFPQSVQGDNLIHGRESAYTLLGAVLGLPVVFYVDKKYLHFDVKATWYQQILKIVVGLALVLAVKAGLKAPLNALLGELPGRGLRYFLTVLTAGCLCPWVFGWITGRRKCSC